MGIGDLGPATRRFLAFLEAGGQSLWQVLPIGVTNPLFGNSPYSSLSAFGLDPLLLSPEDLVEDGVVRPEDADALRRPLRSRIDHADVREGRRGLFAQVAADFRRAPRALRAGLERFRAETSAWVEDLALFLALHDAAGGKPWTTWPEDIRDREPKALERARRRYRTSIDLQVRLQFLVARQWQRLRSEATDRGVLMVGDLPLYVGHDSVDVWCHRDLFRIDGLGAMDKVAGVPPDTFSPTGQLWGNPTYHWARHAEDDYAWWTARARRMLDLFDAVRLDHFRGLAAFWEVPAGSKTARDGVWVPGPGADLLETLARRLPRLPLIAEDLGVIDAEVRALMSLFGLPGMRVLQFAFGGDFPRSEHLPHTYDENLVVFTGTHDNDTVRGWFDGEARGAGRRRLFRYLGREVESRDVPEAMIRLAYASVASWALVPLQDVLGLGASARINRPGRPKGNWRWRAGARAFAPRHQDRLAAWAEVYGRSAAR